MQLMLVTIGVAFVLRNMIQYLAGTSPRALKVDINSAMKLPAGMYIGRTQLYFTAFAYIIIGGVALMLKFSNIGKKMRALADNRNLAETSGINTNRVILFTWLFASGLAGLAGICYVAGTGSFDPNFGFTLLLTFFAAVVLGGIGNPYGGLMGGVTIGLAQEWSTLYVGAQWKILIGFAILILCLMLRPTGLLGKARVTA